MRVQSGPALAKGSLATYIKNFKKHSASAVLFIKTSPAKFIIDMREESLYTKIHTSLSRMTVKKGNIINVQWYWNSYMCYGIHTEWNIAQSLKIYYILVWVNYFYMVFTCKITRHEGKVTVQKWMHNMITTKPNFFPFCLYSQIIFNKPHLKVLRNT